jgi:hypothetical protein
MEEAEFMKLRTEVELIVGAVQWRLRFGDSLDDVVRRSLSIDIADCSKEQIHETNAMLLALLAQERNRAAGY